MQIMFKTKKQKRLYPHLKKSQFELDLHTKYCKDIQLQILINFDI